MSQHHVLPVEKRTAVILVNWNGWRDCIACIDSLLGMDGNDFDIFVVDNASSDGSVERIRAWCEAPTPAAPECRLPGVRFVTDRSTDALRYVMHEALPARPEPLPAGIRLCLLRSGGNLGFAGGNNVGLRAAVGYAHYWLLNTDTVVHALALRSLLDRARSDAGLGMIGSTLLYFDRPDTIQAMGGAWLDPRRMLTAHIGVAAPVSQVPEDPSDVERRMAYVVGASMLVSAAFVREVGPMQEDYFLYFEELDWAMRARGRFGLAYAPHSVVYHRVGATSAKKVSVLAETLQAENRIRVLGRFFRPHAWTALPYMGWVLLRHLLKGRFLHARIHFRALCKAPRLLTS